MSTPVAGSLATTPLFVAPGDVAVWWNDPGGTWESVPLGGPTGPTGATGPAGPTGATGPAGSANMSGMVAGQLPIAASATSVTSSVATLAASFMPAHTGDVTSPAGSTVNTLATVNSNVGTWNNVAVNGKGQVTAGSNVAYVTGGPYLPLSGGTLTGPLTASLNSVASIVSSGAADARLMVGNPRTADGNSYIDLVATNGGNNDLRLIRAAGANGGSALQTLGTGDFSITMAGTTRFNLSATANVAAVALNLQPTVDNFYVLGGGSQRWGAVYAANGTIQTSDARAKVEVEPSDLGLDFITALKPVSYRWEVGGNVESGVKEDGEPAYAPVPGKRRHYGLVAQEVKEVLGEKDFGGWVLTDLADPNSQQALRYDQFIAPLIKGMQEQQAQIATLESRLRALESGSAGSE